MDTYILVGSRDTAKGGRVGLIAKPFTPWTFYDYSFIFINVKAVLFLRRRSRPSRTTTFLLSCSRLKAKSFLSFYSYMYTQVFVLWLTFDGTCIPVHLSCVCPKIISVLLLLRLAIHRRVDSGFALHIWFILYLFPWPHCARKRRQR